MEHKHTHSYIYIDVLRGKNLMYNYIPLLTTAQRVFFIYASKTVTQKKRNEWLKKIHLNDIKSKFGIIYISIQEKCTIIFFTIRYLLILDLICVGCNYISSELYSWIKPIENNPSVIRSHWKYYITSQKKYFGELLRY